MTDFILQSQATTAVLDKWIHADLLEVQGRVVVLSFFKTFKNKISPDTF